MSVLHSRGDYLEFAARCGLLLRDHFIGRFERLKPIGGADIFSEFDGLLEDRIGYHRIERPVEGDPEIGAVVSPRQNWLGSLAIGVGDFEDFSFALGAGAPVGLPAVTTDVKSAARGNSHIGGEHREPRDYEFLANITARSFNEVDAPDFSARFAGDQSVALPPFRAEERLRFCRLVKNQAASGLMLRSEGDDGRFADQIR